MREGRLVDWINLMGTKKVHSFSRQSVQTEEPGDGREKVKANRGSGGVDGPARKRASSDPSIAREFREKSSLNVARTNKPKTVPAAQAASFLPLFGNDCDVRALA